MKKILIASLFTIAVGSTKAAGLESKEEVKVLITENGFEPSQIKTKAGSHVVMKVTRTSEDTCATVIQVKEKMIKKELPLNQEVTVDLGVLKKGDIKFACAMDMISGHIVAD